MRRPRFHCTWIPVCAGMTSIFIHAVSHDFVILNSQANSHDSPGTGGNFPCDGGDRRPNFPADATRCGARLPRGRRDHRSVGIGTDCRRGRHAGFRGNGRRAAALPHRARTRALSALGVAPSRVRAGRGTGRRDRHRAHRHRGLAETFVAGGDRGRVGTCHVIHGHSPRVAGRTRSGQQPERARRVRDPALSGCRGDSPDRAAAACSARTRPAIRADG